MFHDIVWGFGAFFLMRSVGREALFGHPLFLMAKAAWRVSCFIGFDSSFLLSLHSMTSLAQPSAYLLQWSSVANQFCCSVVVLWRCLELFYLSGQDLRTKLRVPGTELPMGRTMDGTWYVLSYCPTFFFSQKMSDFWFPPELHHNGFPNVGNFLPAQTQRPLSIGRIKNWATEGIW